MAIEYLGEYLRLGVASEERTIPGVTCLALYSHLFMYKFHRILNLSTFFISESYRKHMTFQSNYVFWDLTNFVILNFILHTPHVI